VICISERTLKETRTYTISELAEVTGVSVASVKFYLREQVLSPGDQSRPHRAYYGPEHVERLRLIRALRDVGDLSVASIREVVSAIDKKRMPTFRLISDTLNSLGETAREHENPEQSKKALAALKEVDAYLHARGINVGKESRARASLAEALTAIRELNDQRVPVEALGPYVDAARTIAEHETDIALLMGDAQKALRLSVLGTILWERVLVSLRRILHEHLAAEVYGRSGAGVSAKGRPGAR
jgi:DNA-binding transcriptional MerR regulator